MFQLWEDKLRKNGVDFINNINVEKINEKEKFLLTSDDNKFYYSEKVFFCIPPKFFTKILIKNETLYNHFSKINNFDLKTWSDDNSYIDDISITFHWKDEINSERSWGFPRNDWGMAYVILSDYMKPEEGYKTVISSCITFGEVKSKLLGKSPFELLENGEVDLVINEAFRQLSEALKINKNYDKAILKKKGEDSAYVETNKQQFFRKYDYESEIYYVGTQNGNSYYHFTSMESAVTNALFCLKDLGVFENKIERPFELIFLIRILIVLTLLVILFYKYKA